MKTRKLLRISQLIEAGACPEQVKLFRKLFGKQVFVTVKRAVSVADKFDFSWAARTLLTPPARADFDRVCAPAWEDYDRVYAAARADRERVIAPAWAQAYINQED